jgi:hypothetical protein
MDANLRRAWVEIVTADDYDSHMAAIGQAQAGAALLTELIHSASAPTGGRVVMVGAGTGQVFDFLEGAAALLGPYRLTCTDLSRRFWDRLRERLSRHGLMAEVLEDDIENTSIEAGADLMLATLVLEHIDWRRGVEAMAGLRPAACGIVIQENPPEMASAVTPGRVLPPSIAEAVENAHPTLVPCAELETAFAALGYQSAGKFTRDVADGKRLVGMLFREVLPGRSPAAKEMA